MKAEIFLLFAGCALVQSIPDLSSMCSTVEKLDCLFDYTPERYETLCASNNQTYTNFCFYSQVRCKFPDVHVVGVGTCDDVLRTTAAPTTTTTPKPTTPSTMAPTTPTTTPMPIATSTMPTTTVDHVKETFCKTKDVISCPTDLDPICASDKTFYLNKCEFSKATCDNPTLVTKDISFCTNV